MLLTVLVASAGPDAPDAWLIVPGVRAGAVTIATSERDLVELFGRENVIPSDIPIGEGLTVPGTLLFPQDSTRKLVVIWKGPDRQSVREVRVTEEGTLWSTDTGITIGTSLKEIERINQRPFRLSGFDWDYGGTVLDWSGGELAEFDRGTEGGSSGRNLILRLAPRDVPRNQPDYWKVKGSREFSSGHPSMQAFNPVVYELIARFNTPRKPSH